MPVILSGQGNRITVSVFPTSYSHVSGIVSAGLVEDHRQTAPKARYGIQFRKQVAKGGIAAIKQVFIPTGKLFHIESAAPPYKGFNREIPGLAGAAISYPEHNPAKDSLDPPL